MSQWELLVTEGHVRAARWRNVAPVFFAGAVAAVILGVLIASVIPQPSTSTRVSEARAAYAEAQRSAVIVFMQEEGEIDIVPAGTGSAPTPDAAAVQIARVVTGLNVSGRLPADVTIDTPDSFWRGAWQPGRLHAIRRDRTVVIGQLVMLAPAAYRQPPVLGRRYSLLRQGPEGAWRSYCLTVPGAPCDGEAVDPARIPATLRPLMPRAAFADRGEG